METITGVPRDKLRPDLYDGDAGASATSPAPKAADQHDVAAAAAIDPIEAARAAEYLLLARLLRQAPSPAFLADLAGLEGDPSPLGLAHIELAGAAGQSTAAAIASEYFTIFIGVGRGELLPYASYYLTGFLNERPLARLREDLGRLGIERAEGNFDPEDHLGLLFETMAGFAQGEFEADLATQRDFFLTHIAPWADRFFADLGVTPSASFYKAVAAVGSCFMTVERDAFEISD